MSTRPVLYAVLQEMRIRGYAWSDLRDAVAMQELVNELEWALNRCVDDPRRASEMREALRHGEAILDALLDGESWGWRPLYPGESYGYEEGGDEE